jgi:hypothetical protein
MSDTSITMTEKRLTELEGQVRRGLDSFVQVGNALAEIKITRDLKFFAVAMDQQWGNVRSYPIDAQSIADACGLKVSDITVKASKR